VHSLDRRLEPKLLDDVGIEARAHAPCAGRCCQEVHVQARPARPFECAQHGQLPEFNGTAAEPGVQLVDTLVGGERIRIDIEMTAVDLTVGKEAGTPRITVTGQAEQRGLIEAVLRHARRDGSDLRGRHQGSVREGRPQHRRRPPNSHASGRRMIVDLPVVSIAS
jgi:hypothetical protein